MACMVQRYLQQVSVQFAFGIRYLTPYVAQSCTRSVASVLSRVSPSPPAPSTPPSSLFRLFPQSNRSEVVWRENQVGRFCRPSLNYPCTSLSIPSYREILLHDGGLRDGLTWDCQGLLRSPFLFNAIAFTRTQNNRMGMKRKALISS